MSFNCEELSRIWQIAPTKTSQSWKPWIEKAVKLWQASPTKFMEALLEAEQEAERSVNDSMSEAEWMIRRDMKRGKVDREVIHDNPHATATNSRT